MGTMLKLIVLHASSIRPLSNTVSQKHITLTFDGMETNLGYVNWGLLNKAWTYSRFKFYIVAKM